MADSEAAARPYAKAVFELAREANSLTAWSALLANAANAAVSPALLAMLDVPGADTDAAARAIADVCGKDADSGELAANGQALNFLRLVADNQRLDSLPAIADAFEQMRADVENTLDVTLRAATPVDDAQQARMAAALKTRFGRDVRLHFVLDESLIGGARLQADDHVIDGSVTTRLAKLASALVH
ncbi:MAG: F0F1 ATP synthase subunit delta [Gammaproteobacteria bacterium]